MMLPFLAAKVFQPRPVPALFVERFPSSLTLTPSHLQAVGADTALMVEEARRLSPRYRSLRMPVAVLWGAGDKISTPSRQSERFVQETGAEGVPLAGVGHMVHWAAPEQVSRLVELVGREAHVDGPGRQVPATATSAAARA